MIFPRTALRLATTAAPRRAVVAQPRLAATVSAIRAYSGPTQSEEAAKADAYHDHKDHKDMQKETVEKHGHERRADKVTASPNDDPTHSEDVAHAEKDNKSPEQLQKETAQKASPKH